MENDRLEVFYEGMHSYDIVYRADFNDLANELSTLNCLGRRICIVTDSNVGPIYASEVAKVLKELATLTVTFIFPAGEDNKNLTVVKDLYTFLIQNNFDRNDLLIALGGGVVGDLTGFTAATYLRGIRFVQVPTTLLAMSDSSIGGKTGVDFDAYKNMIGAFYMPILVYMNINTLSTLRSREFYSGFGEIIKHGYIKDKDFLNWIIDSKDLLSCKEYKALKEMTIRNCKIKKAVVENDPKEKGERALLNFGHTLGHAIEKLMNFTMLHGECVAVGMTAAAYISFKRGKISMKCLEDLKSLLVYYNLPTSITGLSSEDIVKAAFYDKKKDGNEIKFILLNEVGNAVIDATITIVEMKEALDYILV